MRSSHPSSCPFFLSPFYSSSCFFSLLFFIFMYANVSPLPKTHGKCVLNFMYPHFFCKVNSKMPTVTKKEREMHQGMQMATLTVHCRMPLAHDNSATAIVQLRCDCVVWCEGERQKQLSPSGVG